MAFEIRNIGEALDLDTGQVITLTPDYIKQLDDDTLQARKQNLKEKLDGIKTTYFSSQN